MTNIYRYEITPNCTLELPHGFRILNIDWSKMHKCASLWATVDIKETRMVKVNLKIIPTGLEVSENDFYLGSFQTPEGLVFHVFKHVNIVGI
jgi:hypothetical protein